MQSRIQTALGKAALRSLGRCTAVFTGTVLIQLAAAQLGLAQAGTISVQARADLAGNVGAMMTVRLNAAVVGTVEVRSTTWKIYSFDVPGSIGAGALIDIAFTNDAFVNGVDRNLYVNSLEINGVSLSPAAAGVIYDKGAGAAAYDGVDTVASTGTMPWSGALRFPALAGISVPPASVPPVVDYEYDANGNPTKTTQAKGVSGFGFQSKASYDALNRRKDATDAKNGVTQFGYDGLDRTTSIRDPRTLLTQYPRNGLGDVTQLISPDTGTASNTYDAAGNLKTRTDSRGVLATYSYDPLNRLSSVVYSKAGSTSQTLAWNYDETGAGFANGIGRLTSTTHATGSTQHSYDAQGRLTTDIQRVNAASGANAVQITTTVGYQYDSGGRVIAIVYPSGRKLSLTYTGGQLSAMGLAKDSSTAAVPLISDVKFEPFGGVRSWQWELTSGPLLNERVFDSSGRMVRYRLRENVRDLSYDAAGRITAYTHYNASTGAPATSLNQSFGYDELGRLTSVTYGTSTWSIGYDANGNRTGVTLNGTPSLYTVSATSNRLDAITNPARSFSYDNAGNTVVDTSAPTYNATYDLTGRLATMVKGGVSTTYSIDAQGRRVRKVSSTGAASTVIFVYDQAGHLLGEYDSAGNAIREYVWLGDTPLALFTPDPASAANPPLIYFIYADHLNTPRIVVNKSNQLRWRWLAEPFGTTAPENNPGGLGAFTLNLRFPGQSFDQESGLHYNLFRDYDSTIGRYVQSDPVGLAAGIDTYTYVDNNPTKYVDPSGLSKKAIIEWTIAGWKHVWERHVCKGKNVDASKFKNGSPISIQRDAQKVADKPDKITIQQNGRILYEKEMGRVVGDNGETIQRVVVDGGKGVTTFPSLTFKDVLKALMVPLACEEMPSLPECAPFKKMFGDDECEECS